MSHKYNSTQSSDLDKTAVQIATDPLVCKFMNTNIFEETHTCMIDRYSETRTYDYL